MDSEADYKRVHHNIVEATPIVRDSGIYKELVRQITEAVHDPEYRQALFRCLSQRSYVE